MSVLDYKYNHDYPFGYIERIEQEVTTESEDVNQEEPHADGLIPN